MCTGGSQKPGFDVFRGGWNRLNILQLIEWLPTRHDHWVQSPALHNPGMMAHAYNSRIQEVKAGEVQGQASKTV